MVNSSQRLLLSGSVSGCEVGSWMFDSPQCFFDGLDLMIHRVPPISVVLGLLIINVLGSTVPHDNSTNVIVMCFIHFTS